MPTATNYFGYTLTNLGPLTSTFTPDAACATASAYYAIADAEHPVTLIAGQEKCGYSTYGTGCFPSGTEYDAMVTAAGESLGQGYIPYFSPASDCPAGWSTVGLTVGASATANNASGIFTEDLWPYATQSDVVAAALPVANVEVQVLGASETLIWCCPSGHEANIFGGCVSSVGPLSSYSFSDVCIIAWPTADLVDITTFDGSSWSPLLISITPAVTELTTITETIEPSDVKSYIVVHTAPVVALVHQESESSGSDSSGGKKNDGAARASLLPLGLLAIGFLAGAGLVFPW